MDNIPSEYAEFEKAHQEKLKTEVRKPSSLKIDTYLEKYKEIEYVYDFNDNWQFKIKLEEIVDIITLATQHLDGE